MLFEVSSSSSITKFLTCGLFTVDWCVNLDYINDCSGFGFLHHNRGTSLPIALGDK